MSSDNYIYLIRELNYQLQKIDADIAKAEKDKSDAVVVIIICIFLFFLWILLIYGIVKYSNSNNKLKELNSKKVWIKQELLRLSYECGKVEIKAEPNAKQ